jgi:hypothetical protein
VTQEAMLGPRLPVVLAPVTDELLSSWISRHADFYGIPSVIMLQHCLLGAGSLRTTDLHLTEKQAIRLAHMLGTEPTVVRGMSFANMSPRAHRMLAAKPIQSCSACMSGRDQKVRTAIRRNQFFGWRLTCPLCGNLLHEGKKDESPSPFRRHAIAALDGEKLIDDEAKGFARTWAPPSEIARLLMMRRIPKVLSPDISFERFRVLGAVIPEFDEVVAGRQMQLPSSGKPILPTRLRPACKFACNSGPLRGGFRVQ